MGWLIALSIYLMLVGVSNIDFASSNPSPYANHWLKMGTKKPTGDVHYVLSFDSFFAGLILLAVAGGIAIL